jgi:hypothetical protein
MADAAHRLVTISRDMARPGCLSRPPVVRSARYVARPAAGLPTLSGGEAGASDGDRA